MMDFAKIYLYRMTHIENIPHILQNGITHVNSKNSNPDFKSIEDETLIVARNSVLLKNGRCLSDYIPFYFGVKTPMLYVIQKGFNMVTPIAPENIVYCVSSVQKILESQLDFLFTDGHAVNQFTTEYAMEDIANITTFVDWNAIKARYWKNDDDLDLKRRKEAEFLVLGDVLPEYILGFCVFDENTKTKMLSYGLHQSKIVVKQDYYF